MVEIGRPSLGFSNFPLFEVEIGDAVNGEIQVLQSDYAMVEAVRAEVDLAKEEFVKGNGMLTLSFLLGLRKEMEKRFQLNMNERKGASSGDYNCGYHSPNRDYWPPLLSPVTPIRRVVAAIGTLTIGIEGLPN
ncbi:hypothetical protein CRG98_008469 [Punica granatum]|uniref:Uncharacterized protein n=1 Tax=Punica granatum TaxID=22663 RepID=A0A2I0KRS7_PUNGR|nr:hypothetical protein CRG98_008469 [Punica granatum]